MENRRSLVSTKFTYSLDAGNTLPTERQNLCRTPGPMFRIPFHQHIRFHRLRQELTQKQVATKAGLARVRYSHIECDERTPTDAERGRILSALDLPQRDCFPIRPSSVMRRLRSTGNELLDHRPFFPPQDRPNGIRYCAAKQKYPSIVQAVTERLRARADYEDIEYLTQRIACGSREECMYLLQILDAGARPALVPLTAMGFLPHRVVDPRSRKEVGHRPFPCFVLDERVYFFQVSFLVVKPDKDVVYSVDTLVWQKGWTVVEIDGDGHEDNFDRDQDLQLKVIHFAPSHVLEYWTKQAG